MKRFTLDFKILIQILNGEISEKKLNDIYMFNSSLSIFTWIFDFYDDAIIFYARRVHQSHWIVLRLLWQRLKRIKPRTY